jgi:hypothetical protein
MDGYRREGWREASRKGQGVGDRGGKGRGRRKAGAGGAGGGEARNEEMTLEGGGEGALVVPAHLSKPFDRAHIATVALGQGRSLPYSI